MSSSIRPSSASFDQGKTTCPDTNCGPTAAVSSFVYLQNVFPNTYKVPLVPSGQEVDTANKLSGKDFHGYLLCYRRH